MTAEQIVVAIARALAEVGIPHMTVGGIAGIYYGIGRLTDDADFVIQVDDLWLTPLRKALGPAFSIDPQPRIETVTLGTYYVVTHKDSDFDIDLFILRDNPHERVAFSRRRMIDFEGGKTPICTPEDYIITKLLWAKSDLRSKDAEDARSVLSVQKGALDYAYIRHWCEQHQTAHLLDLIMNSLSKIPPT
jgi:hypothetical protein